MQHVLVERIIRGQVESAAEPPDRGGTARRRDQESHIRVRRRRIRVARMENQGYSHGFERRTGHFGALLRGRLRHRSAEYMRERDARTLEHGALAEHAALTAAALGSVPRVAAEFRGIYPLERIRDAIVQIVQVLFDGILPNFE